MSQSVALKRLRKQIEKIDKNILSLLAKRFGITKAIQNLKRGYNIAIFQKSREKRLLKLHLIQSKHLGLSSRFVKKLFSLIFSYSKKTGIIK